jgi:hypothetical protein
MKMVNPLGIRKFGGEVGSITASPIQQNPINPGITPNPNVIKEPNPQSRYEDEYDDDDEYE